MFAADRTTWRAPAHRAGCPGTTRDRPKETRRPHEPHPARRAPRGCRGARIGARRPPGQPLPRARARAGPAARVDGLRLAPARPHRDLAAAARADDPAHRAPAPLALRVAPAPAHGP